MKAATSRLCTWGKHQAIKARNVLNQILASIYSLSLSVGDKGQGPQWILETMESN